MTARKTRASKTSSVASETVAATVSVAATALVAVESIDATNESNAQAERAAMLAAFAEYRVALADAFASRSAYETAKDSDNDNIQKTIKELSKSASNDVIALVMFVASVDANFINSSERKTARFNVYAAQKVDNIARVVAKVETLNHYSLAILKTAIALDRVSLTLSHRDAQSACSLDVRTINARESLVVKYAKHIAANTAATQSSSSINALKMFDVLRETRDDANETCYRVNYDSQVTQALIASF